jgi:putative endonuclease
MHPRENPSGTGRSRTAAPPDGRRRLGSLGEELAAAHFERLGFSVLARNVRTREGEIDLVVFDGDVLAFAEVKTRRVRHGLGKLPPHHEPLASLQPRQRVRLRRLAVAWLSREQPARGRGSRPTAPTIRFDAVGVVVDNRGRLLRLDHVEGAW